MREIKFRAWDLLSKSYIHLNDKLCNVPYYEIFNHTPDSKPWIVEQNTGLKDKKGKEIYEGDILEFDSSQGKSVLEVYFNYGAFSIKSTDELLYEYWYPEGYLEIIGNIHENKELLNDSGK